MDGFLVVILKKNNQKNTKRHLTSSIHFESGLNRKLSTLSLQAGLVVLATLCSIFVELTQVQRLRSGHKTCREDNASFAPYTQSRDLLV